MSSECQSDGSEFVIKTPNNQILAKFTSKGFTVYDKGQPFHYYHGKPTQSDWKQFCASVLQFHGIVVPDNHRPVYLGYLDAKT